MLALLINGNLDERADAALRSLAGALGAGGWSVVADTKPAANPVDQISAETEIDLLVATNVANETFAADLRALPRRSRPGLVPLAIRLSLGPDAATAADALPLTLLGSPDPASIRALALAYAPQLRINAVVTALDAATPRAFDEEIAAAVLLVAQSPSMTGVTICLDAVRR